MGMCFSYRSNPDTEKHSSDKSNENLNCGTSTMQGWRDSQQDAHNAIIDYDTDTSYFAVYDGHGGDEVALYCSQQLPQFLKELDDYKNGNIEKALEEAFLQFDGSLMKKKVFHQLGKLREVTVEKRRIERRKKEQECLDNLNQESAMLIGKYRTESRLDKRNEDEVHIQKKDSILNSSAIDCPSTSNMPDTSRYVSTSSYIKSESSSNKNSDNESKSAEPKEVNCGNAIVQIKVDSPDSSADTGKVCTETNNILDTDNGNQTKEVKPTQDDYDEKDGELVHKMKYGAGMDSGSTAVVALLKGNKLYVANAGDCRCVVCRNGKPVEMSLDHKPRNEVEHTRIKKAGGYVNHDGRVNSGLNLSRALGDHKYKQKTHLSDREQMIIALPDVKTLTINPGEDEFMVLACDGIWNSMSNQEVVNFIRTRIEEGREKLSQICEEMFDHCLAPTTFCDAHGCDNMTAVIVQFKDFPEKYLGSQSKKDGLVKNIP